MAETLGFVMTKQPDFDALPPATPAAIRQLLRRCLDKDPKQRLRDIGEARIAIDAALSDAPAEEVARPIVAVEDQFTKWIGPNETLRRFMRNCLRRCV